MNDEKLAEKLSEEDKKKITDAVSATTKWLDSNQQAEKEEFEEKQKVLETLVTPLFSSAGGAGGMPGNMSGGTTAPGPSEAADEGPKIEEID